MTEIPISPSRHSSLSSEKAKVRKLMRSELNRTSQAWLEVANIFLKEHLQKFIRQRKDKSSFAILGWIPHFFGEADLIDLSEADMFNWFCPCCSSSGELEFFRMPCELQAGALGMLEPNRKLGQPLSLVDYKQIICLVPGLAFDRTGGRLGRGKGMYDRFLKEIGSEASVIKIGVCWSFQLCDSVPTELHDQKMDIICSEQGLIEIV